VAVGYNLDSARIYEQFFPLTSAAVGISTIVLFRLLEPMFEGAIARKVALHLGRISYSVYLFHLLIAMTLKPMLSGQDVWLQLVLYVMGLAGLASIMWFQVERPILGARPTYANGERRAIEVAAPRLVTSSTSRIITFGWTIAACVTAYYCIYAYQGNHQRTFYLTLVGATGALFGVAHRERLGRLSSVALTFFFVATL